VPVKQVDEGRYDYSSIDSDARHQLSGEFTPPSCPGHTDLVVCWARGVRLQAAQFLLAQLAPMQAGAEAPLSGQCGEHLNQEQCCQRVEPPTSLTLI